MLLWSIFCVEKVWFDSFIQKIQEIQYASLTAARKSDQSFHHVNLNVENLIEFKAAIKWACENNAEQNEDSNQCFHLHHSFHLRCYFHQCTSNLQCNHQISINSQSSHLTLNTVRKIEKQKEIFQKFCSQNDKHSE